MTISALAKLSLYPAGAPVQIQEGAGEIRITVPANVEASLVEAYDSQGGDPYSVQTTLRVALADNARLTHYKVVQEGPQADHHSFLEATLARSAYFESHVFLFNGARVRNTLQIRLSGEGAECLLRGLYLGTAAQVLETHTLIEHLKPHGTSREFYKGILDQEAHGLFDGLIVVGKEAQQTDSAQTNKNLLLSSTAKAKSNPELKILANDVKCKHGSTIGQIDPHQLFYLRSRGISLEEARRLLIYAFAQEMVDPVALPELKEKLTGALFEKFRV